VVTVLSKSLLLDLSATVGVAAVACGAAVVLGQFGPETQEDLAPGMSPSVTSSVEPGASFSPSPSPLPSVSPSVSTEPSPAEEPEPPAPAPASRPTNTAFGDMYLSVIPAAPFEVGPIGVYLQGEIRLAPGATVSCTTTMGGLVWPQHIPYIGEPWIGNFHPYAVDFDNIILTPGEYPYTTTCTASDGVSWHGSGTAHEEQFIGYGAEWP